MDEGYPDKFIVELVQLMIKNGIYDAREFYECEEEINKELIKLCKKHQEEEPDFESLTFFLTDLKEEL